MTTPERTRSKLCDYPDARALDNGGVLMIFEPQHVPLAMELFSVLYSAKYPATVEIARRDLAAVQERG
jgi:hypothetical protein